MIGKRKLQGEEDEVLICNWIVNFRTYFLFCCPCRVL